jgi:stage II sporulation protein D
VARYPGALSVKRADDGTLALTVTLPFEDYLKGIAEVPPSWPRSALEAQAVAARSYALATTGWDGEQGETQKTPICAPTSCPVNPGIPVPFEPDVRRWYAAVRRTTGEVLLHDGRPADTVYFSTSNGQTYGNEEVFGSAPLPYLRPVVERDDGASPVSRWRVRLPFDDLATFLHEAGEWPRPPRDLGRRSGRVDGSGRGDGTSRSMDLSTFRDAVNVWARACGRAGTCPRRCRSRSVAVDDAHVRRRRRGRRRARMGHGAGMVQWGAYGKARRGFSRRTSSPTTTADCGPRPTRNPV